MKNHTEEGNIRRNRNGNLFFGIVLFALAGLLLASCTDFYSTSWGEALARDPSNVKVTASNVNELLRDANGDTKASRAILEKLKGTTDPTLQAASVKAANQAAGLTELVLSNLGVLTADGTNTDALTKVAETVFGEAKKNDITGVANDVAGTLENTLKEGSTPEFKEDSFAKSVSTSDLTLLLVTVMMGEAVKASDDFDAYANTWGSDKKNINEDAGLDKNEKVIAAIANEVISRPDSELGNMLKNLVGEK